MTEKGSDMKYHSTSIPGEEEICPCGDIHYEGEMMTPEPEIERLPESAGRMTLWRLQAAVDALKYAEEAESPKDKMLLLKRADEHMLFARRSAEALVAQWRELNQRAEALGAWIEDEG